MKDRISRTASLFMLGLTLSSQPGFGANLQTNLSPETEHSVENSRIIPVSKFGQYGHTRGMGLTLA